MQPTFIGIAQLLIGTLLLAFGSIPGTLAFVILSGLMGGSAALLLPALGGSSIPPVNLALVFLVLRLLREADAQRPLLATALRDLAPLAVFVSYGVLIAIIGPRLFAGQIDVTPMRGQAASSYTNMMAYIYAAVPLRPTSQNMTTSIYLTGTLILAIAAHVAISNPRGRDTLVRTGAIVGLVHAGLGVLALLVKGTPADAILQLFRNGSYAMLDHSYQGFVRITGIFPEASGYGTYGLTWMVFLTECALRGIRPRLTGAAALALFAVLIASTSTTAYFGLGLYVAVLLLRMLLFPGSIRLGAMLTLAAIGLVGLLIVLGVTVGSHRFAAEIGGLIRHFTVDKGDSLSGLQRSFWARQGLDAFVATFGIGIGPGSFRSSSIATAILGSTGVIGASAFLILLVQIWQPWRRTTFEADAPDPRATGAAAAWACLILFATQSISAATPDPGADFAILAGGALALRRMRLFWRPPQFEPQPLPA
ncbi:hypothetical protein [Sphingomonas radiodurans]|uniref:hypothetical protein n=1 Tax=Sphingomonas radiodurans TaxID=2890321 RepID=UPI001E579274|nr:hypothetical protein [Sphingomonas radiodurans]WBH17095.1 hypothetical protein LLW23_02950 [Sphingomonas radiodurans]